jgi:hypothetical protein
MATLTEIAAARVASTSNTATYATPSFTPTAGRLLVVVARASGSVTNPAALTASANGLTFTQVHTQLGNASVDRNYIFIADQAVPGSPAAMTLTLALGADPGTGALIDVYEAASMSRVGTSAVKQTVGGDNNLAASGTPSVTFASNITAGNPVIGFVSNNTSPATITEPSGWTEDADHGFATPTSGMECCHIDSHAGGTATVTWGNTSTRGATTAIELDTSSGTTPGLAIPRRPQLRLRGLTTR